MQVKHLFGSIFAYIYIYIDKSHRRCAPDWVASLLAQRFVGNNLYRLYIQGIICTRDLDYWHL